MTIGERIKNRRKELHLSVNQLADRINKNRATVYRYESDEIENYPYDVIELLANALNTTPSYLMGWEDNPNSDKSNNFPLSDLEKNIIKKFRSLSGGERAMFLRSIGVEEKEDTIKMA